MNMRKMLIMITAMLLFLNLAACGSDGGKQSKKTITFDEMVAAFKNAGYEIKVYDNYDDVDPELKLDKATSMKLLSFAKIDEAAGKEYMGGAYFYQFANEKDAASMVGEDSTPGAKTTKESYGMKTIATNGDSKAGVKWITLQVGNVVIIMHESYDVDGNGTYTNGVENVLGKLGL